MNIQVRYYSRGGNTKKLADVIAKATDCKAEQIPVPIDGNADILFLGASVYWGGISPEVKSYIKALDKNRIGKVVVFSTSALAERAFDQIQKMLQDKGINVDNRNFYCHGEFTALHKGRPNQNDLEAAKQFARKITERK
ncbi:MAG: flavodoxin [Clostridiales bacterium]|nr:flavodoxin [Clostridiales bacterium]